MPDAPSTTPPQPPNLENGDLLAGRPGVEPIPRLALRPDEMVEAVGISPRKLSEMMADQTSGPPVVRLSRNLVLFPVDSVVRWCARSIEGGAAAPARSVEGEIFDAINGRPVAPVPRLMLKRDQAAAALGIGPTKLWEITNDRSYGVPVVRFSRRLVRYSVEALRRWLDEASRGRGRMSR